ncbi:LYR motif containing protein 1 [Taenia crassiceps]|uniref:LYR motif containing protein 1 n=1 Tax=Taenia crassiceps TaxID=6207 RepID=A0ABR4Q092_9CEST
MVVSCEVLKWFINEVAANVTSKFFFISPSFLLDPLCLPSSSHFAVPRGGVTRSIRSYMASVKLAKSFTLAPGQQRVRVLDLYRRFMQLSKTWVSATHEAGQTAKERAYIRQEARTLFRRNALLSDPQEIEAHILEGVSRLELAQHYKNPYPRLSNLPQSSMVSRSMKRNQRVINNSVPAYLRSYKADSGPTRVGKH